MLMSRKKHWLPKLQQLYVKNSDVWRTENLGYTALCVLLPFGADPICESQSTLQTFGLNVQVLAGESASLEHHWALLQGELSRTKTPEWVSFMPQNVAF